MPRIYFDTEFEGLFENAGLISIGLVDNTGTKKFYAELSDTYKIENCSIFCKSVVIPLLDNKNPIKLNELNVQLFEWLKEHGKNTVLICDSIRDIEQIKEIFPNGLPENCSYKVLGFYDKWKRRLKNYNRNLYKKHKLRDHHALDDAIINKIIFEGKHNE